MPSDQSFVGTVGRKWYSLVRVPVIAILAFAASSAAVFVGSALVFWPVFFDIWLAHGATPLDAYQHLINPGQQEFPEATARGWITTGVWWVAGLPLVYATVSSFWEVYLDDE